MACWSVLYLSVISIQQIDITFKTREQNNFAWCELAEFIQIYGRQSWSEGGSERSSRDGLNDVISTSRVSRHLQLGQSLLHSDLEITGLLVFCAFLCVLMASIIGALMP